MLLRYLSQMEVILKILDMVIVFYINISLSYCQKFRTMKLKIGVISADFGRFWMLQDGNEVFFRIKRSTQLKKLMNAYCDRQSVDFNSIAFLFDGRRLRAEQTPDEVCVCIISLLLHLYRVCIISSLLYQYQLFSDHNYLTFMFYYLKIYLVAVGNGRW